MYFCKKWKGRIKSNEGQENQKETKRKAEVATAGMKRKASSSWVEACGLRL
jgi:hypothetical protein